MTFICGGPPTSGPRLRAADFLPQFNWCCHGAAERGARYCTCWEPVYEKSQQRADVNAPTVTRDDLCSDCAYRPDSPERKSDPYALVDLETFWCHKGMQRPKEWCHPDGRVRPAYDGDYHPLMVGARPYRIDGRPAVLCGGWAMQQRVNEQAREHVDEALTA